MYVYNIKWCIALEENNGSGWEMILLHFVELFLRNNLGAVVQGENILGGDPVPVNLEKNLFKSRIITILIIWPRSWLSLTFIYLRHHHHVPASNFKVHLHHPDIDPVSLLGGCLQSPITFQFHQVGHLFSWSDAYIMVLEYQLLLWDICGYYGLNQLLCF